jgi:hypothetical protein
MLAEDERALDCRIDDFGVHDSLAVCLPDEALNGVFALDIAHPRNP